MGKKISYLMLDKNDITKICGVISRQEAIKKMNMNQWSFESFLAHEGIFMNKYILVEEDFSKSVKRKEE